jgi:hypothetical protein
MLARAVPVQRGTGSRQREKSGFRPVRDVSKVGARHGRSAANHTDHIENIGFGRFDHSASWPTKVRNVSRLGSQTLEKLSRLTPPAPESEGRLRRLMGNDHVDYRSLHELFREVYVVDREDDPLNDPDLPHQVRQHRSRRMSAVIARVCREQRRSHYRTQPVSTYGRGGQLRFSKRPTRHRT